MKSLPTGLLLLGLAVQPALAEPSDTNFTVQAESIGTMRTEVALLQEEIRDERNDLQSRLRTLEAQRSDVALQMRRQKAMTQELRERVAKLKEQHVPQSGEAEIDAMLLRISAQLKEDIRASIPYRHQERLKSIDEILLSRESEQISALQAAVRLWSLAEDEERLNKENQLDSVTIELNGKEMLVDIVRLGMITLLYQSKDGHIGVWSRESGWTSLSEHVQEIQNLFRQFQKGIRTGTFYVPFDLEGL